MALLSVSTSMKVAMVPLYYVLQSFSRDAECSSNINHLLWLPLGFRAFRLLECPKSEPIGASTHLLLTKEFQYWEPFPHFYFVDLFYREPVPPEWKSPLGLAGEQEPVNQAQNEFYFMLHIIHLGVCLCTQSSPKMCFPSVVMLTLVFLKNMVAEAKRPSGNLLQPMTSSKHTQSQLPI